MKKKLKLEVLDPVGNVVTTHHFHYDQGMHNKIRITIDDKTFFWENNADLEFEPVLKGVDEQWATEFKNRANETQEQSIEPKYFNKETGKMQKLFCEEILTPVWDVSVSNDNLVKGDKGCAVYIVVEAEDAKHAMDKAMLCGEFISYIHDVKNFDRKYLHVHKPVGNYVIGKVRYFEGDPRL